MKPTLKLYEIANEYQQALDALSEMEDMSEEAIKDTLDGIKGEFNEKAINVALYIKTLEAETSAIREQIYDFIKRSDALSRRADNLRDYLIFNMKSCGSNKIGSELAVLEIRKNPLSVDIYDETEIPENFMQIKVSKSPMKATIKQTIENGDFVPGARLIQNYRLVIK